MLILLGVIGRAHGVRGLVHVTSYTDPPEAIAGYGPLVDESGRRFLLRWRGDGVAEIVDGVGTRIADRTAAERLTNTRLYVDRDQLPAPEEDEFYLADLVGLAVADSVGAPLGAVVAVHDYGAGASLEIEGEGGSLVVPFTRAVVPVVDVAGGRVVVDPPGPHPPRPHPPRKGAATSPASGRGEADDRNHLSRLRERAARASAPGEGEASA